MTLLLLISLLNRNTVLPIRSILATVQSRMDGNKAVFSDLHLRGEMDEISRRLDELFRELDARQDRIESQSLQLVARSVRQDG